MYMVTLYQSISMTSVRMPTFKEDPESFAMHTRGLFEEPKKKNTEEGPDVVKTAVKNADVLY